MNWKLPATFLKIQLKTNLQFSFSSNFEKDTYLCRNTIGKLIPGSYLENEAKMSNFADANGYASVICWLTSGYKVVDEYNFLVWSFGDGKHPKQFTNKRPSISYASIIDKVHYFVSKTSVECHSANNIEVRVGYTDGTPGDTNWPQSNALCVRYPGANCYDDCTTYMTLNCKTPLKGRILSLQKVDVAPYYYSTYDSSNPCEWNYAGFPSDLPIMHVYPLFG